MQRQIIETDLTNARNPSAVVSSRIAAVKSWEAQRFGVEEYIERHGVDEDAENKLRACPGEIQQQVVASDLSNARNPSAVLLARIRNLESQVAPRYPEVSGDALSGRSWALRVTSSHFGATMWSRTRERHRFSALRATNSRFGATVLHADAPGRSISTQLPQTLLIDRVEKHSCLPVGSIRRQSGGHSCDRDCYPQCKL